MTKNALIAAVCAFVALSACAKKAPLTPATPWADVLDDSLCFFTTAIDPSGLKVQYVYDWGNGDSSTTGWYKSGDTACRAHAFPDTGTFHVKVMARNEQGRASDWSGECPFHVSTPPQLVDTVVGFSRWAIDRWYRPSVKVMDPDGDSVSVKFIWGDSMASNWSPFGASGSTVTDSVKWQTMGRHIIHVLLKDKGSMVNPNAGAKFVNVSQVGVLWYTADSLQFGGTGSSTMGIIDGEPVLYVTSIDRVACLGLDGSHRWTSDEGLGYDYAPSLSNDGSRLYITDESRRVVVSLDARTGSEQWSFSAFAPDCTPAIGPDGGIYVTAYDTAALRAQVLKLRDCGDSACVEWRYVSPFARSYPGFGVAVGANGVVYTIEGLYGDKGRLLALDSAGNMLWQDTTGNINVSTAYAPVVDSRGRLIFGDGAGYLFCYNADGTLAWRILASDELYGGGLAVGFDDRIYFPSDDERMYCYDANGRLVWAQQIPEAWPALATPCVLSDSSVLLSCSEGELLGCFSWDGELLWAFSVEDSVTETGRSRVRRDEGDDEATPVVGPDGNVYISGSFATYCLAIGKARLANTAWPTYNHDNARSGWAGRH